jgi:hypothetical protein
MTGRGRKIPRKPMRGRRIYLLDPAPSGHGFARGWWRCVRGMVGFQIHGVSPANLAGIGAGKGGCFGRTSRFLGDFAGEISPSSTRFDLKSLPRIEGGRMMKDLGPVSCKTVAGIGSYRPEKGSPRRREKSRVRREKGAPDLGFPEMETLNPKITIYSKFSHNFRRP